MMALSSVSTTAAATATTAVVSPASYSSSSLHPPPPLRWTRIEASGSPPLARDGHCMTSVTCDDMREVYMFGGVTAAGGGESADLFRLDMDFGEWEKLETKGGNVPVNVPVARSGATLAAVGNDLFLCGGINSELAWLDTVHRFDSVNQTWTLLELSGDRLPACDKLASAVSGSIIYLWGGFGPVGGEDSIAATDDDPFLNIGWFSELYAIDTTRATCTRLATTGEAPSPRAAHAMVCLGNNMLYVFGGKDSIGRQNDLYALDLSSKVWSRLAPMGAEESSDNLPAPRSFHSMVGVDHDRLVVFGGRLEDNKHTSDVHVYQTVTNTWTRLPLLPSSPSPRGTHGAAVVDGNAMIIFGGSTAFDPTSQQCLKFFNEAWQLTLPSSTAASCESASGDVPWPAKRTKAKADGLV